MLTSGWAALEKCHMNDDAAIVMSAEIMPDCHMDMDAEPANNTDHHCDNCNHCIPIATLKDVMPYPIDFTAQDYAGYILSYTSSLAEYEAPPPRI